MELVPLVQNGVTSRVSVNNLKGPDGVRYFQTYATMTALTDVNGRTDNMVVEVASRTTENDGGGGTWRYDAGSSATVSTYSVLAADDAVGRWLRIFDGALDGSVVWDPGSLADGAGETSAAITVTNAAFGDFVLVGNPYDLQGITCSGYVSAAATVRIRLQNETTGVVDLASGTWYVRVLKRA